MKVFTIESGEVKLGASVEDFTLSGGSSIRAIVVGEDGRGRELGVLPVNNGGSDVITAADVGETFSGRARLAPEQNRDGHQCVVVFRTKIGYRGENEHTGDRAGWECKFYDCEKPSGKGRSPQRCPSCGRKSDILLHFADFPGELLSEGRIAQGGAGGMGSGKQIIAILPKGVVFRTGYSGRLYGGPAAHYYVFDGEQILSATWEERELADLF